MSKAPGARRMFLRPHSRVPVPWRRTRKQRIGACSHPLHARPAGSGVQFVEGSRWMTIYEETSYMVG